MTNWLIQVSPILQVLIATGFTWTVTALGAATVFFFKNINRRFLDTMLGFAGGIMIAASFWSLLQPAIEIAEKTNLIPWLVTAIGFLLGAGFLRLIDMLVPHLHLESDIEEREGIKTHLQKTALLVLAITIHNIPEGMAIGVAFGALQNSISNSNIAGAIALTMGIGLQNFPEGMGVSYPLRREGMSRFKSFFYGQLSGLVEPIGGIIGLLVVSKNLSILPYALAFAAGAMVYVVVEEVIPESQANGNSDRGTLGFIIGFTIMMILDVMLG